MNKFRIEEVDGKFYLKVWSDAKKSVFTMFLINLDELNNLSSSISKHI